MCEWFQVDDGEISFDKLEGVQFAELEASFKEVHGFCVGLQLV